MAFVPADRAGAGCIPAFSARENLTLPQLRPLWSKGRLNRRAERAETREWGARVELQPLEPERPLARFSGGNQQKVVLAKWLRTSPRILLLDEPTQGVDVGAKASILALVADAAAQGMAVLLTSAEPEDLVALCDRVLVLRQGRVAAELVGASLTVDNVVDASLGPAPDGDDPAALDVGAVAL
jgi:ribose transport system ATP-binding protein